MNCIVVEDEPAAQFILKQYIDRFPGLTCSGIFHDAVSAGEYLDRQSADLLFLDINLPEMSGISFMQSLVHPPPVIFTTAYPRYATDGFDLEIVDFLLKPFSYERFCKAVNKVKESVNQQGVQQHQGKITLKSGKGIYRVGTEEIRFLEACGDYVSFHLDGKNLLIHGTLKEWEEKLKNSGFLRIHRTIIVNLRKIDHLEGNLIITGNHRLPLSDSCKATLMDRMFRLE
jgi:two-component system, LytTR family, response regulator LytT